MDDTEPELLLIAKACHEVNRAYCQALGDNSQPTWDDAPDWQKESTIRGVVFHVCDPDAGPESSHASGMEQKLADDGWVYGPIKDRCLLPFSELPESQRAKYFIFRAVVNACGHIIDWAYER